MFMILLWFQVFLAPPKKHVEFGRDSGKQGLKKNMSDKRKLPKFGAQNQVNMRVYQKNIAPSKWYVKFQAKPV